MQMDNFMRINLTETFGAGNEPTEEEMNLLLDIAGISYIDDEVIIPAQKIMQWQLADDARLAIQDDLALKANHGYDSNPKTLKEVEDSIPDDIFDKISNSTFEVKLKTELTFEKYIDGKLISSTTAWGATVNFIPIDGADTVKIYR